VIKKVINLNLGNAEASDFIMHVEGNHQSPDTFPGSETGTEVTLGFGSYRVTERIPNTVIQQHTFTQFSQDCSGVIHPDETKTCTVTNIFNPLSWKKFYTQLFESNCVIEKVQPPVMASDAEVNIVIVTLLCPDGKKETINAYREEAVTMKESIRTHQ
jgi:hypothetical protein